MIRDPKLDAIHMHSPIPDHTRMSLVVQEAGKYCVCTVPMATSLKALRAVCQAHHVHRVAWAFPQGCLVVPVTQPGVCEVPALRRRVLADEIALAADVFDIEPLPLADPLLGRHNVVHTPHNAGRTKESNARWAEALLVQFSPE